VLAALVQLNVNGATRILHGVPVYRRVTATETTTFVVIRVPSTELRTIQYQVYSTITGIQQVYSTITGIQHYYCDIVNIIIIIDIVQSTNKCIKLEQLRGIVNY